MSLSTRLAGMFAGAAVVIFALIGTMLYCILDRQTERLQQGEVDVRFNMVSRMLDHPDLAERWPHLQGKLDNLSQEYELIRFWIDSDDPRYHYGRFSEPVQRLIADGAGRYELELPEHRYALTARVGVLPAREGRPRLTYVTAIDSAAFHEARTSTLKWLLGLSALGVLLASLLGRWIARLGLWPVHRLSEEARRISPRQLSQRLQLSPLPAELRELVGAFNGALDRLEQAYVRLESFNADVAHELRTPLTNLIGARPRWRCPANAAANITKRSCNPTWRSWSGCGRSSTTCCSSPAPTRDAWPASARKPRWPARSPPRWISSR